MYVKYISCVRTTGTLLELFQQKFDKNYFSRFADITLPLSYYLLVHEYDLSSSIRRVLLSRR